MIFTNNGVQKVWIHIDIFMILKKIMLLFVNVAIMDQSISYICHGKTHFEINTFNICS